MVDKNQEPLFCFEQKTKQKNVNTKILNTKLITLIFFSTIAEGRYNSLNILFTIIMLTSQHEVFFRCDLVEQCRKFHQALQMQIHHKHLGHCLFKSYLVIIFKGLWFSCGILSSIQSKQGKSISTIP